VIHNDSYERIVLDVLQYSFEARLSELSLHTYLEPHVAVHRTARYLVMRATIPFAGEKVPQDPIVFTCSYPKTWWQAFKKAHFPRWATRRWPVEYTTVREEHKVDAIVIYNKVKVPALSHHVCVDIQKPLRLMFNEEES
jgi:hypothetical protein